MNTAERQIPSVGRIVHYLSASSPQPLGAFVCSVALPNNPYSLLNLVVFDPYGAMRPMLDVPYGEHKVAHWSWPPYQPPMRVAIVRTDPDNDE